MDNLAAAYKNEICRFIKAREEQKLSDLLSKKDPKKSKNDDKQAINIQLEYHLSNNPDISKDDINAIVGLKNSGKEKIPSLVFVSNQFQALVALNPQLQAISSVIERYENQAKKIKAEHQPTAWLETYGGFAHGVSFATHVAKLTHSSINSASSFYILSKPSFEQDQCYLLTESLVNPVIDNAIDNASYSPVATLLTLEVEGKTIASYLAKQDSTPFKELADNQQQLENWVAQFSSVLKTDRLASHSLAKQIYFPINVKKPEYHLLCNVQSSTLAQGIHLAIANASDDKLYKLKEKHKFSNDYSKWYPNKAKLALTSSDAAKNVSPLHSKRSGKITLLSAQPPSWEFQLKPPVNHKTLFDEHSIYWQAQADIKYLKDFLTRFERIELSIKHPKRQKWLEDWGNNIIDEVFYYVSNIHQLPAGWTSNINTKLKSEHQYLLDPYRNDNNFQSSRLLTNWQSVICNDFARWLNRILAGKDKQFTPQDLHTRLWHKLFETALREFNDTIEVDRKDFMEVEA